LSTIDGETTSEERRGEALLKAISAGDEEEVKDGVDRRGRDSKGETRLRGNAIGKISFSLAMANTAHNLTKSKGQSCAGPDRASSLGARLE